MSGGVNSGHQLDDKRAIIISSILLGCQVEKIQ
jgi:hypothetical protein